MPLVVYTGSVFIYGLRMSGLLGPRAGMVTTGLVAMGVIAIGNSLQWPRLHVDTEGARLAFEIGKWVETVGTVGIVVAAIGLAVRRRAGRERAGVESRG